MRPVVHGMGFGLRVDSVLFGFLERVNLRFDIAHSSLAPRADSASGSGATSFINLIIGVPFSLKLAPSIH